VSGPRPRSAGSPIRGRAASPGSVVVIGEVLPGSTMMIAVRSPPRRDTVRRTSGLTRRRVRPGR
jgi:hypothetical protein